MAELSRFFDPTSPGPPLVVVGDIMLDCYAFGRVERISPEAPVPVMREGARRTVLGGAGNVAANLAAMGAAVTLVGRIGDDSPGADIRAACEASGISLAPQVEGETVTKTRIVSGGQQMMRIDRETVTALSQDAADRLVAGVEAHLSGPAGVLVLSDYDKGLFHGAETGGAGSEAAAPAARLIEMAKAAGWQVVVDPKGRDYGRYRGADIVTPNRGELALAVGAAALISSDDVVAAARSAMAAHGLGAMLVTRSEDGLSLVTERQAVHIPAEAREVFDVSGAGDTVVAALALGLARGLAAPDAARIANTAAGIAVGKRGTATVTGNEIRETLRRRGDLPGRLREPLDLDAARAAVTAWKAQGLRVGFTNGCFDILHYGHTSILERSRALCDRLVVGLNSDGSVRRLKGEARPINRAADRAAVLLALRSVDAVVVFEDDTPLGLIEALLPDMLVKGADYSEDQVVGADVVKAHGGEVRLLPLEAGRSTTAIIDRSRRG